MGKSLPSLGLRVPRGVNTCCSEALWFNLLEGLYLTQGNCWSQEEASPLSSGPKEGCLSPNPWSPRRHKGGNPFVYLLMHAANSCAPFHLCVLCGVGIGLFGFWKEVRFLCSFICRKMRGNKDHYGFAAVSCLSPPGEFGFSISSPLVCHRPPTC